MIRHTVVFKLNDQINSLEEHAFFQAIRELESIPGVQKFEFLKQISTKNSYDFGLSMEFDTAEAYERYNNHPDHIHFVQEYWLAYVQDFLELDFEPFGNK